MTATTKLDLELLQNSAANQTLANETFHQLNQLVQAGVVDRTNTPPGSPANEALYIITATATGAWAGKETQLAYWLTSAATWIYIVPREGFLVHVNEEDSYYKFDGSAWAVFSGGGMTNPMTTTGDIIIGGASGTPTRLAAGTNGYVLTLAAGSPTWAAPSSGVSLPVVQALSSTRNLVLADVNTFNVNSTTSNYTVTIPPQSSVAWTADAEIHFLPSNTGDITITGGAGVSVNGVVAGSVTLSTQNGAASIKRVASDSWWVGGSLGTQAEQRTALGLGAGDSPSFAALSITAGALAMTGSGRRITADFSSGVGSLANRTAFQSSTTNGQTLPLFMPNGTSTVSGVHFYTNAADLENSPRLVVNINGGAGAATISSDRTGTGTYYPLLFAAGGSTQLTISTAGSLTAPGVYASTTASAANVFVDSAGLLSRSTSSVKYKTEIEPMAVEYAESSLELQPIWYRSRCEGDNPDWSWWGFSAEQAASVDPRLVHWKTHERVVEVFHDLLVDANGNPVLDDDGVEQYAAREEVRMQPLAEAEPEGFAYERLTVHHHALLKQQRDRISQLESSLAEVLTRLDALEQGQ